MAEYTPNSNKFRAEQRAASEERQKAEKVAKGVVKTKKKNEARRLLDIFVSEDVANVKSYVLMDVLVPAIKKAISDIVTNGIDMVLYGETGRTKKRSNTEYVSYRNYSSRNDDDRRSERRDSFDFNNLVFETKGEVLEVRDQLDDMIERYGYVTVADLYDMAGIAAPYTANKYGWKNIRNAEPVRDREGGYTLKLPKAGPIDR